MITRHITLSCVRNQKRNQSYENSSMVQSELPVANLRITRILFIFLNVWQYMVINGSNILLSMPGGIILNDKSTTLVKS